VQLFFENSHKFHANPIGVRALVKYAVGHFVLRHSAAAEKLGNRRSPGGYIFLLRSDALGGARELQYTFCVQPVRPTVLAKSKTKHDRSASIICAS